MVILFVVVRVFIPNEKDKVSLADVLFSLVFFPVLAFAAVAASMELQHDVHSRWLGTCFWSDFYLVLYVSRMLCHCVIQPFTHMSPGLLVMMTIHHVISMGCYFLGLGYGRCHYWGCLDGCCEITTVFLNKLYLTNQTEYNGNKLKTYLPVWVVATNGFFLWLAFLVFRLLLFPYWLTSFYRDMQDMPEKTRAITTDLERFIYPGTTCILLFLSTMWFIPVTQGMLKTMRSAMAKKMD
eukprot:Skav210401  [mRNA]  locus=scaffold1416:182464:183177:- [translate_table: standard]